MNLKTKKLVFVQFCIYIHHKTQLLQPKVPILFSIHLCCIGRRRGRRPCDLGRFFSVILFLRLDLQIKETITQAVGSLSLPLSVAPAGEQLPPQKTAHSEGNGCDKASGTFVGAGSTDVLFLCYRVTQLLIIVKLIIRARLWASEQQTLNKDSLFFP